jgi:hypothetical protein
MYTSCQFIAKILQDGIQHGRSAWRTREGHFRMEGDNNIVGVTDLSLCWFAQGHDVRNQLDCPEIILSFFRACRTASIKAHCLARPVFVNG